MKGPSADVHSLGHQLAVPGQPVTESSPETSSGTMPMLRSSSVANLQTASKLILSSSLVYSYPLDLPPGVEVVRATPSAGKTGGWTNWLVIPFVDERLSLSANYAKRLGVVQSLLYVMSGLYKYLNKYI